LFFFFQIALDAHPASCSTVIWRCLPGCKLAMSWSSPHFHLVPS